MSVMNKAFQKEEIWKAALSDFKLDPNIRFPVFEADLLYGVVSERVHNPEIATVILSDKSTREYKEFFQVFGSKFGRGYAEFVEELTEMSEEE